MSRTISVCSAAVVLCLLASVTDAAAAVRAIVPIVGSTRGAHGAEFKTMLQLHNRTSRPAEGTLVVHPAGRSGATGDPSIGYALAPHQTAYFEDIVLEAGLSGLATIDVDVTSGAVPAIVCRVYDEQGEAGTTGAAIRAVGPEAALVAGESGSLIAPPDRGRFRMNVGVRSLGDGVLLGIVVYDEHGVIRGKAAEVELGPDMVVQNGADQIAGMELRANESIGFEVREGSAILYASTVDNTTNDPSMQYVARAGE